MEISIVKKQQDFYQLNGLTLAYIGDAAYEVYIRDYLLTQGYTKPNQLHRLATQFVSAKAQCYLMQEMITANILTEEEIVIFKRGRNAHSHTSAKNADITTYRIATGFESLIGILHLTNQRQRLDELVKWCIEKIGDRNDEKKANIYK